MKETKASVVKKNYWGFFSCLNFSANNGRISSTDSDGNEKEDYIAVTNIYFR